MPQIEGWYVRQLGERVRYEEGSFRGADFCRGIYADNRVNTRRREFLLPAFRLFRLPRNDLRRVAPPREFSGRFARAPRGPPLIASRPQTLALSGSQGQSG